MYYSQHPSSFLRIMLWITAIVLFVSIRVAASRDQRALATLDTSALKSIADLGDPLKNLDPKDANSYLSRILIPRPAGSANNTLVRKYIVETLKNLKWHVEDDDTFTEKTPYGVKEFTNIIATWDPLAPKRLVMAAHFDSKYFAQSPQNQFVGATDSAAPCAMILDLAETLAPLLEARTKRLQASDEDEDEEALDTTVQLVFLDGEEAFKDWSGTDNTYGARYLADKWANTYYEPHHARRRLHPTATKVSTIEHFVLLDLLGAEKPLVRSYFLSTAWLFDALVSAETRLGKAGIFNDGMKHIWETWDSFFVPRTSYHAQSGWIGDDHEPFLHRGVPVLHVITEPFPHVWHTLQDDASALHLPTMKRWALIFRVFVAEYMGLHPESSKRGIYGADHEELL